jgi:hypothetical protein
MLDASKAKDVTEVLENAIQYSAGVTRARSAASRGTTGHGSAPGLRESFFQSKKSLEKGGAGERPYEVTIKLQLDGDVLQEKVVSLMGGASGVIS